MASTVYDAIQDFISAGRLSESEAADLLSRYSSKVQEQLICAMYLGNAHLDYTELKESGDNYIGYTDHIPQSDYAKKIYEKNTNVPRYLEKALECARNSEFDLTRL